MAREYQRFCCRGKAYGVTRCIKLLGSNYYLTLKSSAHLNFFEFCLADMLRFFYLISS